MRDVWCRPGVRFKAGSGSFGVVQARCKDQGRFRRLRGARCKDQGRFRGGLVQARCKEHGGFGGFGVVWCRPGVRFKEGSGQV